MTDLRKAAEMALEFADFMYGRWPFDTAEGQMSKRMSEALRQALDKPDIDPQALVQMAVLAEREACAKWIESRKTGSLLDSFRDGEAAAIRARGEK